MESKGQVEERQAVGDGFTGPVKEEADGRERQMKGKGAEANGDRKLNKGGDGLAGNRNRQQREGWTKDRVVLSRATGMRGAMGGRDTRKRRRKR